MIRNRHYFRRVLAFLLCVVLMISNLWLMAFADEPATDYVDFLPPEVLSDEEMIIAENPDDLLPDEAEEGYQQDDPSMPIEMVAARGGLFSESEFIEPSEAGQKEGTTEQLTEAQTEETTELLLSPGKLVRHLKNQGYWTV